MTGEQNPPTVAAGRLFAPLLVLFGCALIAMWPAGQGSGFLAGLSVGLGALLHALVFGADASRRAFPPPVLRGLLAVGVLACAYGIAASAEPFAQFVMEAGLFAISTTGCILIAGVLFGRASALREGAES